MGVFLLSEQNALNRSGGSPPSFPLLSRPGSILLHDGMLFRCYDLNRVTRRRYDRFQVLAIQGECLIQADPFHAIGPPVTVRP